jgi:hypothetical protein
MFALAANGVSAYDDYSVTGRLDLGWKETEKEAAVVTKREQSTRCPPAEQYTATSIVEKKTLNLRAVRTGCLNNSVSFFGIAVPGSVSSIREGNSCFHRTEREMSNQKESHHSSTVFLYRGRQGHGVRRNFGFGYHGRP